MKTLYEVDGGVWVEKAQSLDVAFTEHGTAKLLEAAGAIDRGRMVPDLASAISATAIEPLPGHLAYWFSGDIEDPNVKIYAWITSVHDDEIFEELPGPKRDEVRRWILGGMALERVRLRCAKAARP